MRSSLINMEILEGLHRTSFLFTENPTHARIDACGDFRSRHSVSRVPIFSRALCFLPRLFWGYSKVTSFFIKQKRKKGPLFEGLFSLNQAVFCETTQPHRSYQ